MRYPALFLAACCLLSTQTSANSVYRWVDEEGVMHFSNVPKERGKNAEKLTIRPNLQYSGPSRSQTNNDRTNTRTPAKNLPTKAPSPKLCDKALRWTRNDLTVMRETADRNLQGGHIDTQRHASATRVLNVLESRVTLDSCQSSQGEERTFYQCLANGVGLMACSQAMEESLQASNTPATDDKTYANTP